MNNEKLIQYEEALNVAIQIPPKENEVVDVLEELVTEIGKQIKDDMEEI